MDEFNHSKRKRILEDEDETEDVIRHDNVEINEEVNSDIDSNPDDDMTHNESEEDGEDLLEGWLDDYAPAPELDAYDPTMLATEEVVESFEKRMRDRRAAEEALDAEEERRRKYDYDAEDDLEDANEQEVAELR
jgi:hypothetical protein